VGETAQVKKGQEKVRKKRVLEGKLFKCWQGKDKASTSRCEKRNRFEERPDKSTLRGGTVEQNSTGQGGETKTNHEKQKGVSEALKTIRKAGGAHCPRQ